MSKKFIKDFSIYGIGGIVSRFVGVITAPIYTRMLSTEGYGLLDLIVAISAILIIFTTMEMQSGYARSYYQAKDAGELQRLRGSIIIFFICSYLLLVCVFFILFPFLKQWVSLFDVSLLIPVILGILPTMIIMLTMVTIQFEQKPLLYSLATIGNLLLTVGGGIFTVLYLDLGVNGILWSNMIVSFVVCAILFLTLFKFMHFTINLAYLKELALYSFPIVPAVLGAWVNSYIGRIFIAGALSLSMLGIYSIASKVALIMVMAVSAFRQAWHPRANKYFDQKGSEPQFVNILNYFLLGFSLLVVLIVTASPLIIKILAPKEFFPAIGIIGIITVGSFWDGAKNIFASGNNWERKTYYNSIASIFGGIINLLILFLFLEGGGIVVAAIGYSLGLTIQAGLIFYTSQKNHFIPYSKINLLITFVLLVGYSTISFYSFNIFSLIESLVLHILAGGSILMIMYFTFFNINDRREISKLIMRKTV